MTGPVNVKQISTLNVKNARSGKCEKHSTLNVKKSLASCMTSQMVSLDNLVSLVRFSAFSGFGVSTFQKLKILGSVMILYRKYIDVQRKFNLLTRGLVGGKHF